MTSEQWNLRAAKEVRSVTGTHTRIAWVQTTTDICGKMPGFYRLVGLDTDDGRGIQVIVTPLSNCMKPMITPRGDQIVFTNRFEDRVYVVNWDGTGLHKLLNGYGVAVWRDPSSGIQWVYARTGHGNMKDPIYRFQIDQPEISELVWDKTPMGQENYCWFSLSADGRRAGGAFPWPACGEASLPNGSWAHWGNGCWSSIAPDNSYRFFHFDGTHKHIMMYDDGGRNQRLVDLSGAPGTEGKLLLYPDWSNNVQFMTVTGPAIGKTNAELLFAHFNTSFTAIDRWVRVTRNDMNDLWGNAWIQPPAVRTNEDVQRPSTPLMAPPTLVARDPRTIPHLEIEAKLMARSKVPSYNDIAPYSRALVVYEYQVQQVISGKYSQQTIRIAHWGLMDKKPLPIRDAVVGKTFHLVVEPFSAYPQLEPEFMSDDLPLNSAIPLYYDPTSSGHLAATSQASAAGGSSRTY